MRSFGELWTSGELYKRHGEVRRLKAKKRSASDDAWRLETYVYPVIGHMAVGDVGELDIERVMAKAPATFLERREREMSQGTRRQLYQVLHRLFDLAVRPGRLRDDNPVGDHLKPAPSKQKLFGYLYPDEVIALLGCTAIPVGRRVLYALAVYTGLRLGSLLTLTWGGVDFVHGTLTSLDSKTDLPQMFELPPQLRVVLLAWWERCGRPAAEAPVVTSTETRKGREAATLPADLRSAGVERASLFGGARNVQPMRFHDLRATFVTWALRQGRGKFWIQDRTGHLTDEQMLRYSRQARTLADLQLEAFPDIAAAIPELGELPANVVRMLR